MISRTAEYALGAVAHLAGAGRSPRTTGQISSAIGVSAGYLSKVLQSLGRAGLVQSQRGLHGGFTLTRDPGQLTVLEIVGAVDSLRRVRKCPLGINGHSALCPLHRRLDKVYAMLENSLRETTVADLLVSSHGEGAVCVSPSLTEPTLLRDV